MTALQVVLKGIRSHKSERRRLRALVVDRYALQQLAGSVLNCGDPSVTHEDVIAKMGGHLYGIVIDTGLRLNRVPVMLLRAGTLPGPLHIWEPDSAPMAEIEGLIARHLANARS